ncbi:NAD-dependent epimerase [Candidatus Puniceispirillum sp.]|nr:NAD-dependent epimerase [Candidatus Puniceispirillum sp.]
MKILITGVAGFIGMHVAKRLLERGGTIFGVDSLTDYYDTGLKQSRLTELRPYQEFTFKKCDVGNFQSISDAFQAEKFDCVVHLAAQAGVRFSIKNPHAYIDANIQGFMNVLECCRHMSIGHLVYASSSSVYGENAKVPFNESHNVDHPVSLYAATKKANELMAHTYSHLFGLPTTGLRFFTVYGPWGRPDMAPTIFAKAIMENQKIDVFNDGNMIRDFTYIDDIVEGVISVLEKPATRRLDFDPYVPDPASSSAPYRIFNIGNGNPTPLMAFIKALEHSLDKKAKMNMLPMQPGDVPTTSADIAAIDEWVGFQPTVGIKEGVYKFAEWYLNYYHRNKYVKIK